MPAFANMFHKAFVSMEGWCAQYFDVLWFLCSFLCMFNGSLLTTASFLVSLILQFDSIVLFVSGSNTCTDCVYYVILQKTGFIFNVCLYQIKNIVH